MHQSDLSDPFLRDHIELALRPFVGIVEQDDLEFMRAALARLVRDDLHAVAVLDAARPRSVEQSGECDKIDERAGQAPPAGSRSA